MEGEFNDLKYNNLNITFSNTTNNTATSDELTAALMYQDKMGTEYSKKKKLKKIVGLTGITILTAAAAIKTGGYISNGFVTDPPTIQNSAFTVVDGEFRFSFEVENNRHYKVIYYIDVNKENIVSEDCTEAKLYEGTFSEFEKGDECVFYITFSNNFDYKRTIEKIYFNIGGTK